MTTRPTNEHLTQELALLRAEYAELLTHARAAVAARWHNEHEPTLYLQGHLEERGQLPRKDDKPAALLAQAYVRAIDVYELAGVPR